MKKEPLTLEHKNIVDKALKKCDVSLSEYSFANLYLFRKEHAYCVIFADNLYVEGTTYDGMRFIMPLGFDAWKNFATLKMLSNSVDCVFPICAEWLYVHENKIQKVWAVDSDRDYIYDVSQMAHYSGRRLAKKRNLEKQFLSEYSHYEKPLSKETLQDALHVLEIWQKEVSHTKEHADYEPAKEAIMLHDVLDLEGMLFYSENEPIGVLIGAPLNAQVFVVHFVKADTRYKGIYQYIYHRFSQTLEGKFSLLNMEQDLGDPNLQKTKHSYQPIRLATKYRVKI